MSKTLALIPILLVSLALPLLAQKTIPARILIYSATREFRHDSIPTAIQALQSKASSINVTFDDTEDQNQFADDILAGYDALLFLDNTGEVLDDEGKAAFQRYLNLGGNFIGIHSASDCLRNTTFYERELGASPPSTLSRQNLYYFQLSGAYFDYHPPLQNATVNVIDASHPSTSILPAQWKVQDEMYNFKSDPRSVGAVVILSADESSYNDPGPRNFDQGTPHPTAWYQEHGAGVENGGTSGRSFYTSLGHLNETWQDDLFMAHVLGGITWTLQSNTTRAFNSSAMVGNTESTSTSTNSTSSSGPSTESGSSSAIGLISASTGLMSFLAFAAVCLPMF